MEILDGFEASYKEWQTKHPNQAKCPDQKYARMMFAKYYVEQLGLFSVSGRLNIKVEEMEFKPEAPYLSDVISWENGNIWELHELFPEDQKIVISRNKNYR